MAFGDSTITDNPSAGSDAGAAMQAAMAGSRMSAEVGLVPSALNNAASTADLHPLGLVGTGVDTTGVAAPLDSSKTVSQLVSEGVIQPIDGFSGAASDASGPVLTAGESPQVTVTYADASAGQKPDFIIRQDGTIEASGDPTAGKKQNVVIEVDRAPGSTANLDPTEQQSVNGLVGYLYSRYSAEDPTVAQNGLKLNDQYGLISSDVSQLVAAKPQAEDATAAAVRQNFGAGTQQAMAQASRFTPGSSGSMSRGDIDQSVPERSQPLAKNETQAIADIKNAIAANFRPDAATKDNPDAPYQTSRMDRVGTNEVPAVGRYGMTYPIISYWFAMNLGYDVELDFDDQTEDSIASMMNTLAKHGKVPKAFAAKFHNKAFAHKFLHAMHEMKEGHMPSQAEMKELLPPQMQEQIAADVVGKFAQQTGNDTGKVALAFHLGKPPDQLTAAELADAGNKEYERAADTYCTMSHARDTMGAGGKFNYTVSQDGTLLDQELRKAAINTAESMGGSQSEHLCATGAQIALSKIGEGEFMGTGNGYAMHHAFDRDPNWVAVDRRTMFEALKEGHVGYVCRQWANDPSGAGHVELLTETNNGEVMGASDFYGQHKQQNNYYNWRNDKFYLPRADVQSA